MSFFNKLKNGVSGPAAVNSADGVSRKVFTFAEGKS